MQNVNAIRLSLWAIIMLAAIGCGKKDETAAIRQLIGKGAQMAEAHELGDLMRLTTADFKALPGQHDTRSVKGILFVAFQHYGRLKIHYPRPGVEVAQNGNTATALVHFAIVSQNKEIPGLKELYENPEQWIETASEKADLYQLELALVKEGGDWQIQQAELKGFKGWGF